MDDDQFWAIIDRSREDVEQRDERLGAALGELTPEQIQGFAARFTDYWLRAYRWDIWAVANWIHGWCSDDGFMDFRARLIGLGRERYFAALANPDSLAEVVGTPEGKYSILEGYQYVAGDVFEQKTGKSMPRYAPPGGYPDLPDKNFDMDDVAVMRRKFPRLLERLPTPAGIDPSIKFPERKVAFLGEWNDERLHAVLTDFLGEPLRGEDAMYSRQVIVRLGDEVAQVEYSPMMGVFATGAPGVVEHIVATVTARMSAT